MVEKKGGRLKGEKGTTERKIDLIGGGDIDYHLGTSNGPHLSLSSVGRASTLPLKLIRGTPLGIGEILNRRGERSNTPPLTRPPGRKSYIEGKG